MNINLSNVSPELHKLITEAAKDKLGDIIGQRCVTPWAKDVLRTAALKQLKLKNDRLEK